MTEDDAIEAALLVNARRAIGTLISAAEDEVTGVIEEANTRWKTLCLELWGRDHEEDSAKGMIESGIALPPAFAVRLLGIIAAEIDARLAELGVSRDGK